MKKYLLIFAFFFTLNSNITSQSITRVEPPSWWIGMQTPLQLLIYGDSVGFAKLISHNPKILVNSCHRADSPNYLFADITIDTSLKPGTYILSLKTAEKEIPFNYTFEKRRIGSSQRESFGPQDVVYLIMPDRFANGDTLNDSRSETIEKSNRVSNYGRHGGDILGLINNLDYIQKLGVTAIWSTPLLLDNEKESSYHGYACADYYKIDPRFGTNELYKKFVGESKTKGIKIIMDMVPNHCGSAHWWMKDLPFKKWVNIFPEYTQSNFAMSSPADIHSSNVDMNRFIEGWFDKTMPDMNLNQPFLHKYFTQNAIWWIEWADLSGIRVDTFPYSDKYAASQWVANIRKEYPNISIVGECWYLTPQEISYWEGGENKRDGYNSNLTNVMDFSLQDAIITGFNQDSVPNWGEGLFRLYKSISLDYIYKNSDNLMIFADNHDTHRISELMNKDLNKVKMVLSLLATMRGMPQIYYGTEIMLSTMDGKLGHGEERIDMPGGWPGAKKNVFTNVGLSKNEIDVLDHAKKLFNWRRDKKVIHYGKMTHYWPADNIYVYFRYLNDNIVMVLINNSKENHVINWGRFSESIKDKKEGHDIVSGKKIVVGKETTIKFQTSMIIDFD